MRCTAQGSPRANIGRQDCGGRRGRAFCGTDLCRSFMRNRVRLSGQARPADGELPVACCLLQVPVLRQTRVCWRKPPPKTDGSDCRTQHLEDHSVAKSRQFHFGTAVPRSVCDNGFHGFFAGLPAELGLERSRCDLAIRAGTSVTSRGKLR